MNLQQLEYIIQLDKYRHFGKAAEACQVTQPTLSTMIQKLEEELGVKLFERSRQSVSPTSVGAKIVAQAYEILRQANLVSDIVQDEKSALKGNLKIGILPTIAPYLLPMIIPKIEKKLSNLKITFTELMTSECIKNLEDSNIDIAIIASSMDNTKINEEKLFYEEFMGYVSVNEELHNKTAIRTSEVNGKHLWLLDEGHCFRDQLVKFCDLSKRIGRQFTYTRGSLETFLHFVEMGYGITFVPELFTLIANSKQKEFIRPFMLPRPTRCIRMCTRKDFIREEIQNQLISIIKDSVPAEMHSLRVGQKEV